MQKDLYNNVKSVNALSTQLINTDTATAGEIIDTQGYESCMVNLKAGVVTAGTVIISSIEEGDDSALSDTANIPAARIQGTLTALTAADGINEVGIISTKRYIRINATTATSANLTVGGSAVLGNPNVRSIR